MHPIEEGLSAVAMVLRAKSNFREPATSIVNDMVTNEVNFADLISGSFNFGIFVFFF
jgi:hypothetical protein